MKPARWRKITFVFLAMASILAGIRVATCDCVSPANSSAEAGPQIEVEATWHDFGQVTAGTVLRHEFAVFNRGRNRIVLNQEGCQGCGDNTVHGFVVVPPASRLQLPLTLETAGRGGPLQHVVTFTTSDPRRPRIAFTLTARILGPHPAR